MHILLFRILRSQKKIDQEANKDISVFLENSILDVDQKLAKGNEGSDIYTWLSWLKSNAAVYESAKGNKNDTINSQSKVLKDKLVKVQVRDFPELRDAYTASKKEVLSKENIQIASSGKTNDTLTFVGTVFEPKQTKKQFLKGIDQIVKDLRFKKVVFKWSEKQGDFSDYKIPSKQDEEI